MGFQTPSRNKGRKLRISVKRKKSFEHDMKRKAR